MELFHQLPTVLELSHKGLYSHQHFFEQGMPKWAETNKMELNKKKTKDMWLYFTDTVQEPPPIQIGDDIIGGEKTFKLLSQFGAN